MYCHTLTRFMAGFWWIRKTLREQIPPPPSKLLYCNRWRHQTWQDSNSPQDKYVDVKSCNQSYSNYSTKAQTHSTFSLIRTSGTTDFLHRKYKNILELCFMALLQINKNKCHGILRQKLILINSYLKKKLASLYNPTYFCLNRVKMINELIIGSSFKRKVEVKSWSAFYLS